MVVYAADLELIVDLSDLDLTWVLLLRVLVRALREALDVQLTVSQVFNELAVANLRSLLHLQQRVVADFGPALRCIIAVENVIQPGLDLGFDFLLNFTPFSDLRLKVVVALFDLVVLLEQDA